MFFPLKAKSAYPQSLASDRRETAAASWKWYRMMDDMLRTKHHINPQAQCDYPKDAAAVSSQEQAQGKRRAVCEEEDTAVRIRESRTGWFSFRIWRGEMSGGRTDQWSEKSMRGRH